MGGTRAAVAAGIIAAKRDGGGADDAVRLVSEGGFAIAGTPYEEFIRRYFA